MFSNPVYVATNAEDHQYIEAIGDSVSAMISGQENGKAGLIKALEALKRSLQLHFLIEENMMSDFGYDGLSEHHRSHLLIVSEVNDYLKSIVRNDEEPRVNLWPHVRTTLRHHMQKFDTDFAHYLEQRTARDAAGPVAATPRPPLGALT